MNYNEKKVTIEKEIDDLQNEYFGLITGLQKMEHQKTITRNEIHLQMGTNERTTETNNYQRKYSQRDLFQNCQRTT